MFKKTVTWILIFFLACSGTVMANEPDEPAPEEPVTLPKIEIDNSLTFPKGATLKFYVSETCNGQNVIRDFNGDYEALKTSYVNGALTATAQTGGSYFVDCSDITPPSLDIDNPDYIYLYNVDGVGRINYTDDKTQVNEDALSLTINGKPVRFLEKTKDYSTFQLPPDISEGSIAELTISDNAGNSTKLSKKIRLIPRS